MMSRCTSLVPPPKVRISAARCIRSIRPAQQRAGRAGPDVAAGPSTSISSRYASMANSVPNTLVAEAAAAARRAVAAGGDPPVDQLEELGLGVHPGQVQPHPLLVDHAPAVRQSVPRPVATSRRAERIGAAEVSATRSWLSWLVISGQPWFSAPTRAAAGTRTSE